MVIVVRILLILAGFGLGLQLQPLLKATDPPLSTIGTICPAIGAFIGFQLSRLISGNATTGK